MGPAARRPLVVGLVVVGARAGGRRARAAPAADAGDRHARRARERVVAGDRARPPALRRRRGLRPRPRAGVQGRADHRPRAGSSGSRAASRGNVPKGQTPPGGRTGRAGGSATAKPVKVVFGPGHVPQRVASARSPTSSPRSWRSDAAQAEQAATRRASWRARSGTSRGQGRAGSPSRPRSSPARSSPRDAIQLALKYGITSAPQLNDPSFVSQLVFADGKAAGHAEGALRLPVPDEDSSLIQVRLQARA